MKKSIGLLALAASLSLSVFAVSPASAQSINVLGHRVHQSVSTGESAGTTGGDVTEAWRSDNGDINWITADVTPIHDRLFREMTLDAGNIDLAFFLNRFVSPDVFELLEPLDGYQAENPIEGFDGLSQGMRDAMTYDGKLYGIPFRHATNALIYNSKILADQGIESIPETFAELVDLAIAIHEKNPEVYGFANHSGTSPTFILNLALAHGVQFLEPDYTLNAETPEFIETLETLKRLYDNGGLVRDYISGNLDTIIADMQAGRAALSLNPFGRVAVLNDAALSRFPGDIKAVAVPADPNGVTPAQTEVWYLVIPKNSTNKKLAWSLIRALSSPEATVREALNGNGPVRSGAYQDPRIVAANPAAEEEAQSVASARVAFPGFDQAARAQEILSEEADAMLLGRQTAAEAAANMQARISPLLPAK